MPEIRQIKRPWLRWLSWLDVILQTKRSQVHFLARAHAWVAASVPVGACARGNQSMFALTAMSLFLFVSLPFPLSGINLKNRKIFRKQIKKVYNKESHHTHACHLCSRCIASWGKVLVSCFSSQRSLMPI